MRVMASVPGDDSFDRYTLAVPERLRALTIWLLWRFESAEKAGDKPRKVPYYVNGKRRSGIQGAPDDLAQLATFDQALEALRTERWSGVGIAHVPGCGINSWDFDNCIDQGGAIAPELDALLRDSGTYCEISPSGRGVRMVALGILPSIKRIHPGGYNIELFGESGFVTITGRTLCGEDVVPLPANVENTLRTWLQADLTEQPHTRTDQLAQTRGLDPVYQRLKAAGAIKRDWPDGRSSIVCPFEAEHTSGSGRSDTVYFAPNTNGYANGHFHCLHAHCAQRTDSTFRDALGVPDIIFGLAQPATESSLLLDVDQLRAVVGPLRWVVKHAIPANAIGCMYGAPASFKSFVALDLALHIAHGMPWLGKKTTGGRVVYVAAEGGTGILARLDAWHQKHELTAPDNFRSCITPLMLDKASDLRRLSDTIAEQCEGGVVLIVLDTLSQTMSGDENEAQSMAAYFRNLGAALRARFNCAVLAIHHTGHNNSDRPRGSSVIKGNLDFLFSVERIEGQMACAVTCKKQKDGDEGEPLPFILERAILGRDEDGDELSSLVASFHDNAASLINSGRASITSHETTMLSCIGTGRLYADIRDDFYTKLGNEKPDTKKKAFARVFKRLIDTGVIIEKGNCVFRMGGDD
jgi:hypothetical protein